jgi:peptidoglycan/xylan/chitin deacetylase (PgdA/CDA1 family)
MNALKFNLAKAISKCNKLIKLNKKSQIGQRILMYHSISSLSSKKISNDIYTLDDKLFLRQMSYLKDSYNLEVRHLKAEDFLLPSKSSIYITFDDGYNDALSLVAPIMEELNMPFTVFVATDFLKKTYSDHLGVNELKKLAAKSVVKIGSHSQSHLNLTHLSDKQIKDEIKNSKLILQDIIGQEVDGFSYPFGGVNKRVRDIVEESGYKYATNSCFNINNSNQDTFMLCRNEIWSSDTLPIFKEKINGYWDWLKYNNKYNF